MSNKQAWETWFGTRRWRIGEEYTGTVAVPGRTVRGRDNRIEVIFSRGRFEIGEGGAFVSPISPNQGRRGFVLQEVKPDDGQDIPGSLAVFGEAAVKKARAEYEAIW